MTQATEEPLVAAALVGAFDWMHPDYHPIWVARLERLAKLEADPLLVHASNMHYRDDPNGVVDFINDWGVTVDPRNAGTDRPIIMPFILFPQQREFLLWMRKRWLSQSSGTLVKSRDCGASWLAMAFGVWLCRFYNNIAVGFGSATEDKVDKSGDPDCLFYKGRKFVEYLPRFFRGGWTSLKPQYSIHRAIMFPDTEGSINGEIGDKIGRGGRKTLYVVDEYAFCERPKLIEANLSANTNCCVEMSSVNGLANSFAEHARGGKLPRFDFHYRQDPRKVNLTGQTQTVEFAEDDEPPKIITVTPGDLWPWFAAKKRKTDTTIWNQEYECDFLASAEGIIIPQEWVQAAIGAHLKLGIVPTGMKRGAFDVADEGKDKCCWGYRHGVLVPYMQSWSGLGSTTFKSTQRAFLLADQYGVEGFEFDQDGMGAGVRGDAEKIFEERNEANQKSAGSFKPLIVEPFRGSAEVKDPEKIAEGTQRKNKDFFQNYKAQCWWALRQRFLITFLAVTGELKPGKYDPDSIISLDPNMPELVRTTAELSQPVRTFNNAGKMVVDKTPDDVASPNNADTIMMLFQYQRPAWKFDESLFDLI